MPWPHLGTGTDDETCWMMFLRDPTHIASTFDLFSQPEAINWPLLASEDILHEVIRAESLPQTMKRLVISAFDALRTGYKAAKLSQKSSLSDFEVQRCGDWAEEIGWWSFQWSFQSSCKAIRLYTYIYVYIQQSKLGLKKFWNRPGVDPLIFQDFMNFQEDLAKALEGNDTATPVEQPPVATVEASSWGWALWEYEFKHWRYTKRSPPQQPQHW